MISKKYCVYGRVQGVSFRDFTREKARQFGVLGWVRNRQDGSVEACATASPEVLEIFECSLREGPHYAKVLSLKINEIPLEEFKEFKILF